MSGILFDFPRQGHMDLAIASKSPFLYYSIKLPKAKGGSQRFMRAAFLPCSHSIHSGVLRYAARLCFRAAGCPSLTALPQRKDILPTGFWGRAAQLGLPYPLDVDRGVRVLVQSDITAITFPAAARPLGRFSGWKPALCKRSHRTFWGFGDSLRRTFIIIYSLDITLTEKLMPPPERKNQPITPRFRSVLHPYPSASRRTILSIFRRTDDPSIVQN